MNAAQQVLKNARDVIESGWCRGAYAKNKYGDSCDPLAGTAVEFCAAGALQRVGDPVDTDTYLAAYDALAVAARAQGPYPITQFNDKIARNKEDILKLFDDAIAAAA